jgi:hypothetical protein
VFGWLKHAFSVQAAVPAVPTAAQLEIIDRICREIVRREMTLPAEMALQSSAPLNYLSGQMLRFFEPFLGTILDAQAIRDFATFLEQPGAVDFLCQRLRWIQQNNEAMTK